MRNGLDRWDTALGFEKRLLSWKWLKNLTNGLNMWKMTYIFGKLAQVFEKRLNYVGNDLDLWEMAQICVEMS